jgi:hypothetical protein
MEEINEEKITVKLDGQEVSIAALEEAKQKTNIRIIEDKAAGENSYKTLHKLQG